MKAKHEAEHEEGAEMAGIWDLSQYVVEVFVPTEPGPVTDSTVGKIATGCAIAPDRILTAGHALNGCQGTPQVRWRQGDPAEWEWVDAEFRPEQGGWNGMSYDDPAQRIDAAVLVVPFPQQVGCLRMNSRTPQTEWIWEGLGFPEAGQRGDVRRVPVGMRGNFVPGAIGTVELGTQYAVGNSFQDQTPEENWKGASGSPVVVHGQLVGLVRSVPPNFNATRLSAVPMSSILNDAGFQAAVPDAASRADWVGQVAGKLKEFFRSASAQLLTNRLRNPPFLEPITGRFVHEYGADPDAALAGYLLSLTPCEVIELAISVYEHSLTEGSAIETDVLARMVSIALPVTAEKSMQRVLDALSQATGPVLVPFTYFFTGELAMSCFDRRFLSLRASGVSEGILGGTAQIELPATEGLEGDKHSGAGAVLKDIARKRDPTSGDILRRYRVRATDTDGKFQQERFNQFLKDWLSEILKEDVERETPVSSVPRRYYFCLEPVGASEDGEPDYDPFLADALCEANRLVPHIVVMKLQIDSMILGGRSEETLKRKAYDLLKYGQET